LVTTSHVVLTFTVVPYAEPTKEKSDGDIGSMSPVAVGDVPD
jgi:hypothetical protein